MNPDTLVRIYLTAGFAGTVLLIAALLLEVAGVPGRAVDRIPLTRALCVAGIVLISAALITNFIFVITR